MLGVGPMSKNCVDAVIKLSNDYEVPIFLIASRRQIEAEDFGGGYVNNWSTERFAEYVREEDKKGNIILSRDHGGPWQNEFEKQQELSFRKAMESAKKSFKVDIESGFEMIHIDCSVDIFRELSENETLLRIFELYEYCWSVAENAGSKIIFEIGSEEQSGSNKNRHDVDYIISETINFCKKNKLPLPTFVVIQTGTKVVETKNVGTFDSPLRVDYELPAEIEIPRILDICSKYNILLKQHNTDYLSSEALRWHPKLGIHSANVAPEFGVAETRAFVDILHKCNLNQFVDEFIEIAYESKKWKKWMEPNSTASDYEKAIIAGHYVFSDPVFSDLKLRAKREIDECGVDLDEYLVAEVAQSIMRYLYCFGLLEEK